MYYTTNTFSMYQTQTFCYWATPNLVTLMINVKSISFCCSIIAETASAQVCWTMPFPREAGVIYIVGKIRNVFRK